MEEKKTAEQILKELHEKEIAEKGKCQDDVGHVRDSLQKGTFSKRDFLCDDLIRFVEGIDPDGKNAQALGKNLEVDAQDEEASFLLLNQILTLENAPLGKWTTNAQSPFWQQVDVNLVIQKCDGEAFENVGKVIAARAKGGAQKVAFLKELLANDLVEKASLLANYDKPDEAFESLNFYHGEEKNNAYAEYPTKWHRIRDDRLNEYSALYVADDPKMAEETCKELQKEEKTTGRIAALLGSEAQGKDFYEKVILPYVTEVRKEATAKEREAAYAKAREEFLTQKKVVTEMQERLGKLQKSFLKNWRGEKQQTKNLKAAQATIEHAKKDLDEAEKSRTPLSEQREKLETQMNELLGKLDEVGAAAQAAKTEWTRCNDVIRTGFDQERELRASVNPMMKLLNKKKYEAVMEQADKYQKEAIEAQEKSPATEKKMKELSAQYDELNKEKEKLQKDLEVILEKASQINKAVNGARQVIARKEEEEQQLKVSLETIQKEREDVLESWSKETGEDKRTMLNLDFVKDLLSGDKKVSEKREKENPWFSPKYQKEREKLFELALKLNKTFAEASGCLAANLATLSQYLGYWKKNDKKIEFHAADREETAPILWQSLGLFLPMVMVDCSRVSELFGDARKPGLFGLLVIDGADQAQPQKLIGGIYRGRHAITFSK